jgi:hypothetical protein
MAAGELELVHGELLSPALELVDTFCLTRQKTSTAATYRSSCGRFASWLVDRHGPRAGPDAITVAALAAYQQQLRDAGASEFTVRKVARRSTRSSAGWSTTIGSTPARRDWRCRCSPRAPQTIDGFFFDRVPNVIGSEAYYTALNAYAKSLNPDFITVNNFGTTFAASYMPHSRDPRDHREHRD